VGFSKAQAADLSALFPLFGGFAVILAGVMSDRIGRAGRAAILYYGLVGTTVALLGLGLLPVGGSKAVPVALVALIGFLVIGPYSYLAGAIALDFGGRSGSATASGLIDGIGYLGGGVLAGDTMARMSVSFGWAGAFLSLSGVAALSAVCGYLFLRRQR
jgi:sugar phosphate permease